MSKLEELLNSKGKKPQKQSAVNNLLQDKGNKTPDVIDTVVDRFQRGVVGTAKGLADAGYIYGGIGDGNNETMDRVLAETTPSKQYTYKDVIPNESDFYTNPEGLAGTIAEQAGSTATLATAEAIARPIVKSYLRSKGVETAGIMAGLPTAVGAVLTRFTPTAGNSTVKNVAEKVIDKLANPLGTELVAEAGNTAREVLEETGDMGKAQDAGIKKAVADAPISALTNLIQSATARRTLKGAGNKALNVAVGGASGLVEEGHQTHTERFAKGEINAIDAFNPAEWNEEAKTAGVMGAIGGAGMQGIATATGKLVKKAEQAEMADAEKVIDADFREEDFTAEEVDPIVNRAEQQQQEEMQAEIVEADEELQKLDTPHEAQQPQNILQSLPEDRLKILVEKVQAFEDEDVAKQAILDEVKRRGISLESTIEEAQTADVEAIEDQAQVQATNGIETAQNAQAEEAVYPLQGETVTPLMNNAYRGFLRRF